MNTDDPTYEYVPGYGWMPKDIETLTRTAHGKHFTLVRRNPSPGEKYYASGTNETIEQVMNIAIERYANYRDKFPISGVYNTNDRDPAEVWSAYKLITLIIEDDN